MSEVAINPIPYIRNAANCVSHCAVSFIKSAKIVVKSVDGLDAHLRLAAEVLSLSALIRGVQNAAAPIFVTRAIILMTRVPVAVHYFVSGDFMKDIREGRAFAAISSVTYGIGRACYAVLWCVEHNVINSESCANFARKIGSIPVFGLGVKAMDLLGGAKKCLELIFFIESCAFAANNYSEIGEGTNVAKNYVEIVGSTADVALAALGLLSFGNPYVKGFLGLVAAGSYCRAFLLDPANTELK